MPATPGFYSRVFALAVAAALGYALLLIFTPFALPMTWAAFLAFLLFPLNLRLRRRFRGNSIAAGALTVLAPIVILLPLSAISAEFVSQISVLLRQLQKSATEMDIKSFSDLQQFPWIARINTWLQAHADISAEQVQSWLVSGTREVMQRAASWGGSFFLGALGSLLAFAIMLFLLFFFLRDGDVMIARARRLIPMPDERKERLFTQLSGVTRAIVYGTTVTALLQGILLGVGFAIAGLPSPVVFGVLAALLSLLPVGGSAFVWIPAVIWLFFDKHWGYGIFLLVWGCLLGGLDNVLRPVLISGRARISALAVFVGVLGGIPAFGAIGVIAGPVVLSLVLALIEFAEESSPKIS
ncbi:MAG TPA: AI-2E family transporter [Steroidobacteraceae bacterium]|jgi:predicted PurR-regulated permease PerM|nr:AI-2E family transporter [Steroidobacteraceae bacterium]